MSTCSYQRRAQSFRVFNVNVSYLDVLPESEVILHEVLKQDGDMAPQVVEVGVIDQLSVATD
jgi:hypothetical protein